ncbi:hypothetical protein ACEWY4_019790 [Coilia grayii]|uniref:Apolipoprotein C-I n=1 Tax=Coilia grayii TaxID=363190 RepID=A0ABD1JAU5_9TELE
MVVLRVTQIPFQYGVLVEGAVQPNLKMRLPVAIAVLVLVLAAHSDAEEAEPTLEQRFNQFQQQVVGLTDDLTEKTKTALEQFQNSDFAVKTRSFFSEQFEKLKTKFEETFPAQN